MNGDAAPEVSEDSAGQVRRLVSGPTVQRAVGRAWEAAQSTAARLPRPTELALTSADVTGVATTAILTDGTQVRAARRRARQLGLPRAGDATAGWAALGALTALLRVADDGRRRAVVIDTGLPRSLFSRWASRAGFAPICLDVTRAGVVGERIDAGGADLVSAIHPRTVDPPDLDLELVRAAAALRRGGVVVVTAHLGPAEVGGLGVPEIRSLIARADEQGLSVVGDLDIAQAARARAAISQHPGRPVGLALVTFRRR